MNTVKRSLLLLITVGALSSNANAQAFIVRMRPTHEVVVRTAPPSPRHIWVDEDWAWRGGRYEYVGGHCRSPVTDFSGYRVIGGNAQEAGNGYQRIGGDIKTLIRSYLYLQIVHITFQVIWAFVGF